MQRLIPRPRVPRRLFGDAVMNRKKFLLIVVVAAAAVAATAFFTGWFRRDTELRGSGTVEARDVRVGSKIGGRIGKGLVREGDRVQGGQGMITFHGQELPAGLEPLRATAAKG